MIAGRLQPSVALAVAITGCAAPLGRDRDHSAVIEPIEATITVDAPVPASLYVSYRAVSYAGHVVEYGVEVEGRPLIVTYGVEPGAALPLATRVFDGIDGAPLLALLADDHVLDVHVGDDALPVRVADYLATTGPTTAIGAIADDLRPVLDVVLPARVALAPVPAFWRNLDEPAPPDGELAASSSAGRPLLTSWSASRSLLGALFSQGPCVRGDRYQCPCMTVDLVVVGRFSTCAVDTLDEVADRGRNAGLRQAPADDDTSDRNLASPAASTVATALH